MSEVELLQLEFAVEEAGRIQELARQLGPDDMLGQAYLYLAQDFERTVLDLARELRLAGSPMEDMPWWRDWQLKQAAKARSEAECAKTDVQRGGHT